STKEGAPSFADFAKGGNQKIQKLLTAETAEQRQRERRENLNRSQRLRFQKSGRIRAIGGPKLRSHRLGRSSFPGKAQNLADALRHLRALRAPIINAVALELHAGRGSAR